MLFPVLIWISSLSLIVEAQSVHHIGVLKDIMMKGDASSKVNLSTVKSKNLFAIGPVESLKGEITVLDGKAYISKISSEDKITTTNSTSVGAALLVYSHIEKWTESTLSKEIETEESLEQVIESQAKATGINIDQPFPFQLKGKFDLVEYHIVTGVGDKSKPHSHEKKVFELKNVKGTLLGFFSKKHFGVFTHMGSLTHVHFVSEDGQQSGHLETLKIANPQGIKIALPSTKF